MFNASTFEPLSGLARGQFRHEDPMRLGFERGVERGQHRLAVPAQQCRDVQDQARDERPGRAGHAAAAGTSVPALVNGLPTSRA